MVSYCPKCGAKVKEEMNFCPKCGTVLKAAEQPQPQPQPAAPPVAPAPYRVEKEERREKEEKGEKQEKEERERRYEKGEPSFVGPLVGGFVLIFLGFIFYLVVTGGLRAELFGALFFVLIGIVVIIGAVYAAVMAGRRHPRP